MDMKMKRSTFDVRGYSWRNMALSDDRRTSNLEPQPMRITEIFHSIQGEATYAGLPCTFVRLTGCPLRCTWCDSEYTFHGGTAMSLNEVMGRVRAYGCRLVEVTGGEPLHQPEAFSLIERKSVV